MFHLPRLFSLSIGFVLCMTLSPVYAADDPKAIGHHVNVKAKVQFAKKSDNKIHASFHIYDPSGLYPRSGYIAFEDYSAFDMEKINGAMRKNNGYTTTLFYILDYEVSGKSSDGILYYTGIVSKATAFKPNLRHRFKY